MEIAFTQVIGLPSVEIVLPYETCPGCRLRAPESSKRRKYHGSRREYHIQWNNDIRKGFAVTQV